jgi:hypothetical protein
MSLELNKKIIMHELKFVINNSKSHQIIEWLRLSCRPDSEFPVGMVSSIYYDTRNWRFLGEKINSDYMKTKVRVRWYSGINNKRPFDASFAEAKFKIGSRREKVRIRTPYSGEWLSNVRLDNPKLLEIPPLLRSKGIVLNEDVYPVFQISYKRLRFVEPYTGSRTCIDYDISAPRVNSYMLPRFNPFMVQTAVFEIKGGLSELPFTLQPLTDLGCRKASFSKYGACYKKIVGGHF